MSGLLAAASTPAMAQISLLPSVPAEEVVDVAEFSARARQWGEARRRTREQAIDLAEQLAAVTGSEQQEPAVPTAAPTTTAAAATTSAPPASPSSPEAGTEEPEPAQSEPESESESGASEEPEPAEPEPESEPGASEEPEPAEPESESESESGASEEPEPAEPEPEPGAGASEETEPTDPETEPEDPEDAAGAGLPEGTTAEQWHALRECESTQNYRAVNRTGRYRGAYQFSIRTWDWVAGKHYPDLVGVDPVDAAPADQDKMAYELYEINGWNPWPTCRKRLPY